MDLTFLSNYTIYQSITKVKTKQTEKSHRITKSSMLGE